MDALIELLVYITLYPFEWLVFERESPKQSSITRRLPMWLRVVFAVLFLLVILGAAGIFIVGITALYSDKLALEKEAAIAMLASGASFIVLYIAFVVVCFVRDHRREKAKKAKNAIFGKTVHVTVDRPMGSVHPEHDDIVYGVNYGYVKEYMGGDGEPQDAYILGVDEPVEEFDGVVIAIIHRLNDNEDKWVVTPNGRVLSNQEIIEATDFQEKFFEIEVIRRDPDNVPTNPISELNRHFPF